MHKIFSTGLICSLLMGTAVRDWAAESNSDARQASMTLQLDQAKTRIAPEIYGQFAEHLGHCIYGGIWVGEDSPIPNTRGIRNDVVAALKELTRAGGTLAGRMLSPTSITGETASAHTTAAENDQHALGRRGRRQFVRHARVHGFLRAGRLRTVSLRQRRLRHRARDDGMGRVHDFRRG